MSEYPKELMELARRAYAIGPRPLVFTEMQEKFRLELATLLQATWQRSRDYTAVLENSIRLNNEHDAENDALRTENDALRKVLCALSISRPHPHQRVKKGYVVVYGWIREDTLSILDVQEDEFGPVNLNNEQPDPPGPGCPMCGGKAGIGPAVVRPPFHAEPRGGAMNIDRQAVARHIAEQIYGMGPIDTAERILSKLAPFFDVVETACYANDVLKVLPQWHKIESLQRLNDACAVLNAHLAAIKGEAMSDDPPTTQAASPKKYHSPDYGRGHIEGWDAGFVRALEMAEYIARSHSHDSNVGDAITDAIRALRERKECKVLSR